MVNIGSAPWAVTRFCFLPFQTSWRSDRGSVLAGGCKQRVKPDASSCFVHVQESWGVFFVVTSYAWLLRPSQCCKTNDGNLLFLQSTIRHSSSLLSRNKHLRSVHRFISRRFQRHKNKHKTGWKERLLTRKSTGFAPINEGSEKKLQKNAAAETSHRIVRLSAVSLTLIYYLTPGFSSSLQFNWWNELKENRLDLWRISWEVLSSPMAVGNPSAHPPVVFVNEGQ